MTREEIRAKLLLAVDGISPLAGEHVRCMLKANDECLAGKISLEDREACIAEEEHALTRVLIEEELNRVVAVFVDGLDLWGES